MSGTELFIRFTARVFRKLLSIYVFSYFPFGFEGRLLDLIVSVPDHCLSFYCSSYVPKPIIIIQSHNPLFFSCCHVKLRFLLLWLHALHAVLAIFSMCYHTQAHIHQGIRPRHQRRRLRQRSRTHPEINLKTKTLFQNSSFSCTFLRTSLQVQRIV